MVEDIKDAEVIKDVEQLIEGLDDVTLAKLEKILSDDLTAESELKMIQDELTEMGMDAEDIAKLYLLGLPNKLGPLGFLALHSVLETDESNIVDVKIGSFEPAVAAAKAATDSSVLSLGDELTRRKAAAASGAAASGAAAATGA